MSRNFHIRIDLRGALRNWKSSEWRNVVTADDGRTLTPDEVREFFFDLLAAGKKFIPFGPCDNFDDEHGCKGHPVADEK